MIRPYATAVGVFFALVVGLGAGTSAVPTSAAAQTTNDPSVLSVALPTGATAFETSAQVESNAAGDTTAVWKETRDATTRLLGATKPAGGTWAAPELIAASAEPKGQADAETQVLRLLIAPTGTAYLLWQQRQFGNKAPMALRVSARAPDGAWTEAALIAQATPTAGIGLVSDLALSPSGDPMVLWTSATEAPSDFGEDDVAPGVAYVTERVGATWQAPKALGAANGISGDPHLTVNTTGAAVAAWSAVDEYEGGPLSWATRAPGGGWAPGDPAYKVQLGPYGMEAPLLDGRGRVHFLANEAGPWGMSGITHWLAGPGARPAKPTGVPRATQRQSLRGWVGEGQYIHTAEAAIDAAGQLVVVYGNEPHDVESGGFGIGAIWAATRNEAGRWSLVPVDRLAETTGAFDVDVSTDLQGRIVATWGVNVASPTCGSVVYRSVRATDGRWSPRVAVAQAGPGFQDRFADWTVDCPAVSAQSTGGASPHVWWTEVGHLVVRSAEVAPVTPAPAAVVAPLLTTTWAAVRRAGGIQLGCATDGPAFCSISRVQATSTFRGPSVKSRAALRARALGCFRLRSTTAVGADQRFAILPRVLGCGRGWVPPTMSLRLLVTVDVPGRAPAARRVTVKVRR